MKKCSLVLLLALFVYAAPAPTPAPVRNPGVVFQVETTYPSSGRILKSTMSVEKPNMKMEILPGAGGTGKSELIFHGDKGENGEVVIVNHGSKEVYVMNDETREAMAGQLGAVAGAVAEALKNLPKEQREAIEKMQKRGGAGMGGGAVRPETEVRNTGERGNQKGYPCVKYEMLRDGRVVREIWTTDWDNIDGGDEAKEVLKALDAFFKAFWKEMPGGGDRFGGQNPYKMMNFDKGFPVVTRSFEEGELESETVLESVTERDLDPDAFEPPKGYRLQTMGPQ